MKGYIKAGILGGLALFIWGFISWMVLPWHMNSIQGFKDEKAVTKVITTNAPQSGVYFVPMQMHPDQDPETHTFIFTSVKFEAPNSMAAPMVITLILQIIAATLIAWLLSKTIGLSYMRRVGFVVIFALAASLVTHMMSWTWFNFNTTYTLVNICDLLIGWFLAGLISANHTCAYSLPHTSRNR